MFDEEIINGKVTANVKFLCKKSKLQKGALLHQM
jgi:hypothetical protein